MITTGWPRPAFVPAAASPWTPAPHWAPVPHNLLRHTMANIKYFNGETELKFVTAMDNKEFAQRFPGIKGLRYDGYSKLVGHPVGYRPNFEGFLPVERNVNYKSNPSLHACDARCLNGTPNGTCECSCGGKNHGRGMFSGLLAAQQSTLDAPAAA